MVDVTGGGDVVPVRNEEVSFCSVTRLVKSADKLDSPIPECEGRTAAHPSVGAFHFNPICVANNTPVRTVGQNRMSLAHGRNYISDVSVARSAMRLSLHRRFHSGHTDRFYDRYDLRRRGVWQSAVP